LAAAIHEAQPAPEGHSHRPKRRLRRARRAHALLSPKCKSARNIAPTRPQAMATDGGLASDGSERSCCDPGRNFAIPVAMTRLFIPEALTRRLTVFCRFVCGTLFYLLNADSITARYPP
jgi:hypothetical protein